VVQVILHQHLHHRVITAAVVVDRVAQAVLAVAVVVLLLQVKLLLHLEVVEMAEMELLVAFQAYPHTMPVVAVVAVDISQQDHLVQVDLVAVETAE
jgi:hypothetical protein